MRSRKPRLGRSNRHYSRASAGRNQSLYPCFTRRLVASHRSNWAEVSGNLNSPAFWSLYTVVVLTRNI